MPRHRLHQLGRVVELLEHAQAGPRVPVDGIFHVRVALEVQVVHQPGDPPQLLVFPEMTRITPHRRLNREDVLAQALALDPFLDKLPGFIS